MKFKGLAKRFLQVGVICLLLALILRFVLPYAAIDIQMHDTYVVVGIWQAMFIVGFFWIVDACFYSFKEAQSMLAWQKTIGWISYGLLHIASLLLVWIPLTKVSSSLGDRSYYRFDNAEMFLEPSWIPIGISLLCLTQVMILLNFMVSLIRVIKLNKLK